MPHVTIANYEIIKRLSARLEPDALFETCQARHVSTGQEVLLHMKKKRMQGTPQAALSETARKYIPYF